MGAFFVETMENCLSYRVDNRSQSLPQFEMKNGYMGTKKARGQSLALS